MTLLITEVFSNATDRRRFKAPRNMLYLLTGYTLTNFGSAGTRFFLIDQSLEPETDTVNLGNDKQYLINWDLAIDGHSLSFNGMDHKAKYITMGGQSQAVNINVSVQIWGDVVKATKLELLWEWFRKGS